MSQIIKLDNPFRKYERQIIQVAPGESVEQIVKREMKDECITYINNQEIIKLERPKRILKEGEFLFIAPMVAGGDDGKTILNIALMIALITYAPVWSNALWQTTAGGMGVFVTTTAFIVGGAMLVSALTPTPKTPSSGFIDDEQSQSFGWNPMTLQRQGISIPRAYGLNKMFGNVIAAHTEEEAITFEETTITEIYYYHKSTKRTPQKGYRDITIVTEFDPRKVNLNALFNLGIGPIREAVVSGTLKLNDENIENLVNVYYEERRGNLRQQPISYFVPTKLEVVVGRLVINGTPITYTTKNKNFDDLEIELSFPKGLFDGSGADLANNTVNVSVEIKKTTDTAWTFLANNVAITDNVGDKTIETYTTVGVFTVDYGSNYDIKVTKVTAERDSIRFGDDLYLDKVREIIDHQFIYPRRALVGINAQATDQLSGSIRFSCLSRGLYVVDFRDKMSLEGLKLMLNFNGIDGATTTIDDSSENHAITLNVTAQLDIAQKYFGQSALLLDGNSDYASIPDSDDWNICENAVDNWTIDFFVKHTDHVGAEYYIGQYEDINNRWYLYHASGLGFRFYIDGNPDIIIFAAAGEIIDTNWHHIALCKVANEYGLYKDGTQVGYVQDNNTGVFNGSLFIGQKGNNSDWFDGHIDHVRIIKQNIFDATPNSTPDDTITVPTVEVPLVKYSNNPALVIYDILTQPIYTGEHSPWLDLSLMLNFNGADAATATIDESLNAFAVNFTAHAQLDTTFKKFGTASLLLDGIDDDVNLADNSKWDVFENLIEDWTIDFFFKHTTHAGTEFYCCHYEDANNRWYIYNQHGDTFGFRLKKGGVNVIDINAAEIADTNWHHVAVCKVGADIGLYLDETQIAYELLLATDLNTMAGSLFIGQKGDDTFWYPGHIDHFRIIKNNIFEAAPVVGLTDTITEPAAEYTDPGNSYAVSRYDGYNPSKLLTADFEELATWCDEARINPVNFGIKSISQATNAIIETTNNHNLKVGDTVLFRGVSTGGMVELTDGITAEILSVTNDTTFTIDLDTSGYAAYTGAEPLLLIHFDGNEGQTVFTDEVGTHAITTIGDTEVNTANKKFGTGSGYFAGTEDVLSINDHVDFDFVGDNTDSRTIDFWVRHGDITGAQVYVTQAEDAANNWWIFLSAAFNDAVRFTVYTGGVPVIDLHTPINTIAINTWYHIAICKVADEYGIYINGVQLAYVQDASEDTFAGKLYIGSMHDAGYYAEFRGWMDELCIIDNNRFNAAPVVGLTDTITVPTAPINIGVGTVEKYQPRFAFNGIFDTSSNMWEAALSVCELCRCVPFWDGDIIRLAIDKAGSSVYAFTMGNILKDSFKQKFIPVSERASELEVHYRDATKDYTRMPFTLVNDDIGNTTSKTRLDLFGITDTDMANYLVDFKLLQNLHLKKITTIGTEIESIVCTIGDIVDIQHDITNWGKIGSGDDSYTGGGRIIAARRNANDVITIGGDIYFDDADWQEGSTTYKLLVKSADDAAPESRTIIGVTESSVAGGTFDITVSGIYSTLSKRDDIWAAGEEDLETNKYRILDIRRTEENRAEITSIEYNPDVYAND